MDGRFHLAAIGRVTAPGRRIVRAVNLDDLAFFILHDTRARYEEAPAKTNFLTWRKPEELLRRIFFEIVLLDIKDTRERNFSRPGRGVFRIVDCIHLLDLPFRVVVDY